MTSNFNFIVLRAGATFNLLIERGQRRLGIFQSQFVVGMITLKRARRLPLLPGRPAHLIL